VDALPERRFYKLYQMEKRRWVFMVGVAAVTYLLFQSLLLPYENALRSLLPDGEIPVRAESSFRAVHSVAKSVMVRNPLTVYASELSNDSMVVEVVKNEGVRRAIGEGGGLERKDSDVENGFASDVKGLDNDFELFVDGNLDSDSPPYENVVHVSESLALEVVRNEQNSSVLDEAGEGRLGVSLEQIVKPNNGVSVGKNPEENTSLKSENLKGVDTTIQSPPLAMPRTSITITYLENVVSNASSSALQRDGVTLRNDSVMMTSTGTKKMRCNMPPKSITSLYEMNRILLRHRRSMV
jgi:hypothetical protein